MIRECNKPDIDQLNELLNKTNHPLMKTFDNLWKERDYWKKFKPLKFIEDNKIVGMVAYTYNTLKYPSTMKIYYLAVDSDYSGKGIAKLLLNKCFDIAKLKNIPQFLYVTDETTEGRNLFKRFEDDEQCNLYIKENEFGNKDYCYYISTNKDKLFEV